MCMFSGKTFFSTKILQPWMLVRNKSSEFKNLSRTTVDFHCMSNGLSSATFERSLSDLSHALNQQTTTMNRIYNLKKGGGGVTHLKKGIKKKINSGSVKV